MVFVYIFIVSNINNKNGGSGFLQPTNATVQKKRIFDAIAASSIISNGTGVETSKSAATWSVNDVVNFLVNKQMTPCTEEEALELIQVLKSTTYIKYIPNNIQNIRVV